MREILFRGKTDKGEWCEGFLIGRYDPTQKEDIIKSAFIDNGTCFYAPRKVIPETIGQYTGLTDKNGTKIFEGDICTDGFRTLLVRYDFFQWNCKVIETTGLIKGLEFPLWHWDMCPQNGCRQLEVIGNIHDNPELLESEVRE